MTTEAEIVEKRSTTSRNDDDTDTIEHIERLEYEVHDPNEKYGIYIISNFSHL